MKLVKNKKGMTLVEIIVSLLIASIVLVMAGSILLSSLSMYDQNTLEDLDKGLLDNAFRLVEEEITYAGEVQVRDTKLDKEEGYSVFKIENGELLYNGNEVYGEDTYHKRTLRMNVSKSSDTKMKLEMVLLDKDKVLLTRESIITFDNMDLLEDSKGFVADKNKTYTDAYVYFKKVDVALGDEPELDYSGTVLDQIECRDSLNDKGKFIEGVPYEIGDFVYLEIDGKQVWYRCMDAGPFNYNEVISDQRLVWKKIDPYHSITNGYLIGDVVIDKNTGDYYKCILSTWNKGVPIKLVMDYEPQYWKKIDKPTETNKICGITGLVSPGSGTVDEKDDNEIDIFDYDKLTGQGNIGEFVKYDGATWMKLLQGAGSIKPGEKNNQNQYVWQKIQPEWDPTSSYTSRDPNFNNKADVVIYYGFHYRVKEGQIIADGRIPATKNANGTWSVSEGWEKVRRAAGGGWQYYY